MRTALRVAQRLVETYEGRRARLWYPRVSLAWLGVVPGPYISDDPSATLSVPPLSTNFISESESNLSMTEQRQGLAEHAVRVAVDKAQASSNVKGTSRVSRNIHGLLGLLKLLVEWLWSNDHMLQARVTLWKIHRSIKHSSHLRHALKNAAGVALLTFPIFLPEDSPGEWLQ